MPLSAPDEREPRHTRKITCHGYRRADGQWDIDGQITDNKAYDFQNRWRGTITPDQKIHDMSIRLTITDDYLITRCEAIIESSPYQVCPGIAPSFADLAGIRIGAGWMRQVRERVGGRHGCTHLVELLPVMATVAFQTIRVDSGKVRDPAKRPGLMNSCHAHDEDSPNARSIWPEFFEYRDAQRNNGEH